MHEPAKKDGETNPSPGREGPVVTGPGPGDTTSTQSETVGMQLAKYNINPSKAFLTLILCTFIDQLGYTLILPLLPQIARGFGASDIVIGLLISSNAAAALVFGPVLGKLSDRFGRKRMLLVSMLGTFASFTLLAFSTDLIGIAASRILDGVFSGQVPIVRAYIADITEQKDRSRVMGKIMASFSLGLIIGPAIGGILGELNWRYPVIFAMILSGIASILVVRILVESMPKERVAELQARKVVDTAAGRGYPLFTRPLVLRLAQVFLQTLGFNAFVSTLPLVLLERFSLSSSQIGILFSVFGMELIIFSAIVLKRVLKRFGEARLLLTSSVLLMLSFVFFPFIDVYGLLFVFVTPPAIGMAFFRPVMQSNLTKAAHESSQGEANGWGSTMQGLAQTIAPIVSTSYLQVGYLVVFGMAIQSYYLIGWTIALIFLGLLVTSIIDVKKYPKDFERGDGGLRRGRP